MADPFLERDEGRPTSTHFRRCGPKVSDTSLLQRPLKSMALLRNSVGRFSEDQGASSTDKLCSLFTKLPFKARRKGAEEPEA